MNYVDWNPHELARQIKALGYGQYTHEFIKNEICGVHLPLITEEHLIEMGITKIGHRIILIRRFSDIINNKIPVQTASSVNPSSGGSGSKYSSPNVENNYHENNYQDDDTPNIEYRRTEMARSPISKRIVDNQDAQAKKIYEKRSNRLVDDSDSSSHRSSRSSRSSSTRKSVPANNEPVRNSRQTPTTPATNSDAMVEDISQEKDNRITCQYCGRKFQPDVAKRHIPVCGRINGKKKL